MAVRISGSVELPAVDWVGLESDATMLSLSQALCTEAALNAVQRTYPQIYKTNDRLLIKPEEISVTARDFVISQQSAFKSAWLVRNAEADDLSTLPRRPHPVYRPIDFLGSCSTSAAARSASLARS